jgi:RHH-type proline utilization regulon transcriptional repressor/proline dehydrogenase/delta 1-pyrroline-5-carboxylate dehydrogenase
MSSTLSSEQTSDRIPISRESIRARHLAPESTLIDGLIEATALDESARKRIRQRATELAVEARRRTAEDGFALSLVHRFGLDTPHGVALMQLAEALPRTVAVSSANALISDKIGSLSWRDAVGRTSSFAERMALHGLDTLARTFREAGPESSLRRTARRILQAAIAVLGRQYVLGETLDEAYRKGRRLARKGYRFSYDMLGEAAMTDAAAREFHRSYLAALDFLGARDTERYAISVKLSALHPRFEERQRNRCLPLLMERVLDIAVRARTANLQLTIDAEESDRLELTLDVFERLLSAPELRGWNGLGLAVQAYQRRAIAVIDHLHALARRHGTRINVRLVKGAYWDTEIKRAQQLGLLDYPIFVHKCDSDVSYLACARRLLQRPEDFFPQFATHNAHTLAAVCELAKQCNNSQFELQRLYGMGDHIHEALLRDGYQSRIYAPIGPRRDLLPYLVRRLLENGASSSFVRQLTDAAIPIEQLVRDPINFAFGGLAVEQSKPPTGVAAPTTIRNQSWRAAKGLDLAMRESTDKLLSSLRAVNEQAFAGPVIDGSLLGGRVRDVSNPANRSEIVGSVVDANEDQVRDAVESARKARELWSNTSAATRAAKLEKAAQLLEDRAPEFIRLAVLEAGKTLDDGIAEVREAVDFCRYYASQCQQSTLDDRRALGVVACISPWNFPLAIFLGQVTGALAAGNTVVAKPAEQTPLIATLAVRLLHESGIPTQALHLVTGDGSIGAALVSHRDVNGVVFTGSVATAKAIAASLVTTDRAALPFIAETGGINAMIVDCSALPEQVVRDVLTSAFQSAGQRCSALRILCLQDEIADRVLTLLKGALAELRVGDPGLLDTDVGPVIDAEAQTQILDYLQSKPDLAKAVLDSKVELQGTFVAPTIIEVQNVGAVEREVFGPVLHVVRYAADELSALVEAINHMGYGLTLGVHTRIRQRALAIADAARVGNIYVNRHQVGAVVGQQPFGGCGLSGTGPKAGGPYYLLRLTQPIANAPVGSRKIELIDKPIDTSLITILDGVRNAQIAWSHLQRRSERVRFACELLTANTSHLLSAAARNVRLPNATELTATLANVAGEENSLQLLPRGVLLCIDLAHERLDALASQILMSVATGNGVLAVVDRNQARAMHELIAELQQMGVQDNLIACVETAAPKLTSSMVTDLAIDGVVFDGDAHSKQLLAALLSRRAGPLLPLLSSQDAIDRFGIEQTITINTAAAGGDPRLLALSN